MTTRRAETETPAPAETSSPAPAPAIAPARPTQPQPAKDIPVEYEAGTEVITTTTHKVVGKVPGQPAQPPTPPRVPLPQMPLPPHGNGRGRISDLGEWLDYWRELDGDERQDMDSSRFQMRVTREPDSLVPGQPSPYHVPCSAPRALGQWQFSFHLNEFIRYIQSLEKSGGVYRIVLKDVAGDDITTEWPDVNGTWRGEIPNPAVINNPQPKPQPSPEPKKDRMTILAEQLLEKKLEGVINGTEEKKDNSLMEQLQAGTIPLFVSSMLTATQAATQKITESVSSSDKSEQGFFKSLLMSDRMQNRALDAVETGFAVVGGIAEKFADAYLQSRAAKQQQQNPQAPRNLPNTQPETEDAIDYIIRKCEAREAVDFATDEFLNSGAVGIAIRAQIKGHLANPDKTETDILNAFISLARLKGKGERAEKLRTLDHTEQFIRRLRQSVLRRTETTDATETAT